MEQESECVCSWVWERERERERERENNFIAKIILIFFAKHKIDFNACAQISRGEGIFEPSRLWVCRLTCLVGVLHRQIELIVHAYIFILIFKIITAK